MSKEYTQQECYDLAKQCRTRTEFKTKYQKAYYYALSHDWDNEYSWFPKKRKPQGYWQNKETCLKELLKYTTHKDALKNAPGAYDAAYHNGWLEECNFQRLKPENGFWSYNRCYETALQYNDLKNFRVENEGAFDAAYKNGWIKEYTWLYKINQQTFIDKIDCVYVYEFSESHSAYVGRTFMRRQEERHNEHCTRENDSVFRFSKKQMETIPLMKVLQDNLTLKEGVELEEFWKNKYQEEGWDIINIAKTGSIGSMKTWSKTKCEKIARQYTTLYDFRTNDLKAYNASKKYGWLNKFDWLKHGTLPGYWNVKENCENESKKYTNRCDFFKNSNGAYTSALKHGWLDEFTWLLPQCKPNGYWNNKEYCETIAKLYQKRSHFKNDYPSAYNVSKKNGWLDEFFPK